MAKPTPQIKEVSTSTTQVDLLHEVAKDRQRIKQLTTTRNRLNNAIRAIQAKVTENEKSIFAQYESKDEPTPEETLLQLDLFQPSQVNVN